MQDRCDTGPLVALEGRWRRGQDSGDPGKTEVSQRTCRIVTNARLSSWVLSLAALRAEILWP